MGRIAIAAVAMGICMAGCATPDPVVKQTPRRRAPVHRPSRISKLPAPARPRIDQPRRPQTPIRRTPDYDASWFPRGRRIGRRWMTIVIHHSATDKGGARAFDRFHRKKGWDELGYHFVIGNGTDTPDGSIEVGPRWHKQKHGAHCKTPSNYYNDHGIGICLVGDFTKSKPSRRQLTSLKRLVRFLSDQCRIPPSRVTTHRNVTHKTACPGRRFSLRSLRRSISQPATATSLP